MIRYMEQIYQLTTVNYDHLFAGLLRHQPWRGITDRGLREKVFLCAHQLATTHYPHLHSLLENTYRDLVYGESSRKYEDFLSLCAKEGLLERNGEQYVKKTRPEHSGADFHTMRIHEITEVIANEIEPMPHVNGLVRRVARMPRFLAARQVRDLLFEEDQHIFEEDYARFYDPVFSKGPEVGRPFLLQPWRVRAGVVFTHGYMAAPLEVRALAEHLCRNGYAVYGVRMQGHGTSPEDLARSTVASWYESVSRGFAIMRSITDTVVLGGFSTGGCLALLAAARKAPHVSGVISINTPLKLQSYSVRIAPSLVTLNSLLKWFGANRENWDYVENHPENRHINYVRNPLTGVTTLMAAMNDAEVCLPGIHAPALVVQASKDPTVNPASGQLIFDKLGCKQKELTYFERDRHGMINGVGREEIFERVVHFLNRLSKTRAGSSQEIPAVAG
jgi:esterase/lipase